MEDTSDFCETLVWVALDATAHWIDGWIYYDETAAGSRSMDDGVHE